MSPDPKDAPTGLFEHFISSPIPEHIAGDFVLPVPIVFRWQSTVPAAAVPEAAVNEYGQTLLAEDEIRVTGNGLVPAPAGDASRAEYDRQLLFRGPIAFRADGGHDLAALLLCEHVGHGESLAGPAECVRPLAQEALFSGLSKYPADPNGDKTHPPTSRFLCRHNNPFQSLASLDPWGIYRST